MYSGFLRYSNLVAIKWQDIYFDEEVMWILIPHSKTDQAGHGTWIPIAATADPCCPVRCTRRFIQLAGCGPQSEGPLIRVFGHASTCKGQARPPSYITIRNWCKEAFANVGLGELHLGTHSFRKGAATVAANTGVPNRVFKRLGRWRSCQRSTGDPRLILGKGYRLVVLGGYGRTDPLLNKPFYPNGLVVGILTCYQSEGLGFESQCVHFGHTSAGGCQRSTGDPRLILGKGYRLVVLGGYGRTDPLPNKPFYPNGLVVGILTEATQQRKSRPAAPSRLVPRATCPVVPRATRPVVPRCTPRRLVLRDRRRPALRSPSSRAARRPAAASASRSAALHDAPCCSQRVVPYCSQRVALCCHSRHALLQPARHALLPHTRLAATTAATAAGGGDASGSAAGAAGAGRATRSAGGATGTGAARGGQRRSLPLPDDPTPQQLREWVLQRACPSGGGFGFLRTAQRRQQSQQETFSPQVLSELFPQRCVTCSVKAAALGACESVAALSASESATALSASESAAALGARASLATGLSSAEALHTFTLDSGASHCFFRDCTTLTSLAAPIAVSLADPTGGLVVARASTFLPCPAVPSGSLSGLHLPTFTTNLRMVICTCSRIGRHLATFTRRPGSSLYTLTTASAQVAEASQVAASSQVSASGQLAASCSCRVLSHQTLLWHHRLGHPSLPRLHIMHSHLLVFGLPKSLPSLPRSPALPCLPCTLHMDVWGPAPVGGTDQERYFLLVVDDYTRYNTVFPLRRKADVNGVLIPLIRATRRQLRERFTRDFPFLRLHSDRGGEFSFGLLAEFYRDEGIVQSFTLPASPQQNGIAERCIGLIMEVARTSRIHAAAPHILWSFAVQYAAHQLNLWPRVSEPKTLPTLWWTGKVGDASVFWVWGALSLVRDAKVSKLSSRTLCCVFLGFPTDAPPWQFYHPRSCQVFSSYDVAFNESVGYYRLRLHASHPDPAPSGVSHVDPPPLVEPLKVSSYSSYPVEGVDSAADDTVATRRSPRLETPPGFPPRPSSPPPQPAAVDFGAETAGAEPGGAETRGEGSGGAATGGASSGGAATEGAGSWGAATGGADSGGPASPSGDGAVGDPIGGPGAGQPPHPELLETLSPQAIRAWIVRRGSTGGGGSGRAGAGAASPRGTAGAGGTGGIFGAGGSIGVGGNRGAAGAGGAGAPSPRGTTGAGPTSPRGTGGVGGAGGAAGARGARDAGLGGAHTGGAGAAGAGDAVRAGGANGAAGSGGTGDTAGARGAGAAGAGGAVGAGGAGGATRAVGTGGAGGTAGVGGTGVGPGGTAVARTRGIGAARAAGAAGAGGVGGATGATSTRGAGGTTGARGPGAAGASGAAGAGGAGGDAGAGGAGAAGVGGARAAGTSLRRPFFYPQTQSSLPPRDSVLCQVLSLPSSTGLPLPLLCPPTDQSQPQLLPGSPLPAPALQTERVVLPEPPASSLPQVPDPDSGLARAASPTITRLLATVVTNNWY
ncbi:unnamed protein product [Closterium sp. NIES-54]